MPALDNKAPVALRPHLCQIMLWFSWPIFSFSGAPNIVCPLLMLSFLWFHFPRTLSPGSSDTVHPMVLGAVIIFILQMTKLRPEEVTCQKSNEQHVSGRI